MKNKTKGADKGFSYRIQHDGWDAKAALQEANRYGMSVLERGMREYVADFARLATNVSASAAKQ